jgi:hypothetical protein
MFMIANCCRGYRPPDQALRDFAWLLYHPNNLSQPLPGPNPGKIKYDN